METLDYTKLFDVEERIILSSDFINRYYSSDSWEQDCIKAQIKYESLKITKVNSTGIYVEGIRSNWYLRISDIYLYQLEPYKDNYEILYAFANNQARQGKKKNISCPLNRAFMWQTSREGYDFWENIYNDKIFKYPEIKEKKEISNKNQQTAQNNNNYEIRLQKQKALVIRGTRPEGNRICSSKHKASIRSGQISYTACHC